jgi:DinB superfamily
MEGFAMNDLNSTLAYLQSTETRLLAQAREMDLNYRPPNGGWSAGQVLAHLIKTEKFMYPMFVTALKLMPSQAVLNVLDRANVAMSKLAGIGFISNGEKLPQNLDNLNPEFKGRFVAPAFLRPAKKSHDLASLIISREKIRIRTLRVIESVPFERLTTLKFSHPILGRFTLLEFVMFLGKHEEWHTVQLKRITASFNSPTDTSRSS